MTWASLWIIINYAPLQNLKLNSPYDLWSPVIHQLSSLFKFSRNGWQHLRTTCEKSFKFTVSLKFSLLKTDWKRFWGNGYGYSFRWSRKPGVERPGRMRWTFESSLSQRNKGIGTEWEIWAARVILPRVLQIPIPLLLPPMGYRGQFGEPNTLL